MTINLECPTCHVKFNYTITVIPGNVGGSNLSIITNYYKLTIKGWNEDGQHIIQLCKKISLEEGKSLLFEVDKSNIPKAEGVNIIETGKKFHLQITPKVNDTTFNNFTIKCPNHHKNRYTIETKGI